MTLDAAYYLTLSRNIHRIRCNLQSNKQQLLESMNYKALERFRVSFPNIISISQKVSVASLNRSEWSSLSWLKFFVKNYDVTKFFKFFNRWKWQFSINLRCIFCVLNSVSAKLVQISKNLQLCFEISGTENHSLFWKWIIIFIKRSRYVI